LRTLKNSQSSAMMEMRCLVFSTAFIYKYLSQIG
jgi:hypothetical protein